MIGHDVRNMYLSFDTARSSLIQGVDRKREDRHIPRRDFLIRCGVGGFAFLAGRLLTAKVGTQLSNEPVARWKFDEGTGASTLEGSSQTFDQVANHINRPMWVNGISGSALRFDGYSTWVTHPAEYAPALGDAFTIELWAALESYPVSEAAFVNQHIYPDRGYLFALDPYGQWGLGVAVNDAQHWYQCWAPDPLPKSRWVYIVAAFDKSSGITLYLDGAPVSHLPLNVGSLVPASVTDLVIGRQNKTGFADEIFPTGVLNGLLDDIRLHRRFLNAPEIESFYLISKPSATPELSVPPTRFKDDPHRPQYHPLPPSAWTNEPHGLIYWKGRYHLFYQKNPNGPYWSQIHWGHMASQDLIHWTHCPIALAPEPGVDQHGCWSGSTAIHNEVPTIIYTGADGRKASICLATSTDDMLTWKKYPGNPVIASPPNEMRLNGFRDPFVWQEGSTYYMIVGSGIIDVGGTALVYRSSDLIHWQFLKPLLVGDKSDSGIFWEMPVFGRLGESKRILMVTEVPGRESYWIGTWENATFIPSSSKPSRLELINHFLSPAIATDTKGRLVAIGIIPETRSQQELFIAGWAHAYSLPRVLSLSPDGTLMQFPLPELETLRDLHTRFENVEVKPKRTGLPGTLRSDVVEIVAEFLFGDARRVGLKLRRSPDGQEETAIYYDVQDQTLYLDRSRSSLNPGVKRDVASSHFGLGPNETFRLHTFVDRSIVEAFINDRGTFTTRVYPTRPDSTSLDVFSEGGIARLISLDVWTLRSIWNS